MDARKKKRTDASIRELNPLKNKINFRAKSLESMIDWQSVELHEPPLTMEIPTSTISNYIQMRKPPKTLFEEYPCHTQGVERYIPLISHATEKVTKEQQDGYILATLEARKKNPSFKTKYQYNF